MFLENDQRDITKDSFLGFLLESVPLLVEI